MSQSVLADFVGTLTVETTDWDEQVKGRVLLGNNQLAFGTSDDDSVSIPLSSIFDVNVGYTPDAFDPVAGTPVTIAFTRDDERAVAIVATDESTIEKFAIVLFKALLNGTVVRTRHPERVGGRLTDAEFRKGALSLSAGAVAVETQRETIEFDLSAITDFSRDTRAVGDDQQTSLVLSHMNDGTAMTSLVTTPDGRILSILGRYLRRKYDELMDSLQQISFSEPKIEVLVTLYSTGDANVDPASVMDASEAQVTYVLEQLRQNRLVEKTGGGPALTARGQVVANHYLEQVND